MREQMRAPLAPLTTLRLGGPARRLVEVASAGELVAAVAAADRAGEPVLVLAGGSNVVIADGGFAGTVVLVRTTGVRETTPEPGRVQLTVQAGEDWDAVVSRCVADGLAGLECLSGVPGSTGATPIQNVGAYGQEVSQTIVAVRTYDRRTGETTVRPAADCGFAYRTSRFKGATRHLVLDVAFALHRAARSGPIRYAELARALEVPVGARPALADVRRAVLALRRGKGMVVDPADPDSVSVGSFFTNPVLSPAAFAALERRAGLRPPAWPEPDGRVKTSAAWLIERAGFGRGYGNGRARISAKHTLALTNRGGTTAELLGLAREVRDGVRAAYDVVLVPEPVLVGVRL